MILTVAAGIFLLATGQALAHENCNGISEQQWVNGSYATCVRNRESGNGTTAQNLYEIEGPTATKYNGDYGWLDGVSRSAQNLIAYNMWCKSGKSPWTPYDHC